MRATFLVSQEEAYTRIDKLLSVRYSHYSRTYFQFLIDQGHVHVNGNKIKKKEILAAGEEVEILFLPLPKLSLLPENLPLEILYEDEDLLALNKPAGMVVHPAPGHPSKTLVNALLFHCDHLQESFGNLRPGIVHRLDKDTSGVILAAKNPLVHARLVSLFSRRLIHKEYLAVCVGNPQKGILQTLIKRHPQHRKKFIICTQQGKDAITHYETLSLHSDLSLVRLKPVTGRTHQIRVHMKHLGCPVLGDTLYGNTFFNQKYRPIRQLLHAWRLSFTHPRKGTLLEFLAPIPEEFSEFSGGEGH